MKELFLFSFVVLFIACQNQPYTNSAVEMNAPTLQAQSTLPVVSEFESMACGIEVQEILDLSKELENPEKPGIHYRKAELSSDMSSVRNEDFVCVAQTTHSTDDEVIISQETQDNVKAWEFLTQKWEYVRETRFCQDPNANSENPACMDLIFISEDGKLFSSASL